MNQKKIARIKKKYGLITRIRRRSRWRPSVRNQHEHKIAKNIVNRNFSGYEPDRVFSTDITQFNISGVGKVYLAAVKDLGTKEIRGFSISRTPNIILAKGALEKALKRVRRSKRKDLIVHSDQGFQFTHNQYRRILKMHGITQSMSRKGNCLDNAPIESFFGHLKDHIELSEIKSFADFKEIVTTEIQYYNNDRPQWSLNKMPPTLYRRHLMRSRLF